MIPIAIDSDLACVSLSPKNNDANMTTIMGVVNTNAAGKAQGQRLNCKNKGRKHHDF